MPMSVLSPAFKHKGTIPREHTGDSSDISPELSWESGPKGTVSYALIVDDPDATSGDWVHWVAWNLRSTLLTAGVSAEKDLGMGATQGTNSWRSVGYEGPCPPNGTHRYFFKVYALDCRLDLPEGATKAELLAAMQGHILGQGELMGHYARRR